MYEIPYFLGFCEIQTLTLDLVVIHSALLQVLLLLQPKIWNLLLVGLPMVRNKLDRVHYSEMCFENSKGSYDLHIRTFTIIYLLLQNHLWWYVHEIYKLDKWNCFLNNRVCCYGSISHNDINFGYGLLKTRFPF